MQLLHTKQTTSTDEDGNLVIQDVEKTYVVKLAENDKFFMVYYNMLKSFYKIKYVKDVMLLVKLAELADYNTGEVTIATKTREDICSELEITKSNLSPIFKRLIELGLLSGEKGVYKINEAVFWKGEASIRKSILKEKGIQFVLQFTM